MNLVTLASLSKQYGEHLLLDQVDLLINQGDRIGLIGPNGSGKTTLLRLIAGLDPPDGGERTIWGGVRVHYLAQEPDLQDDLSVLETLFRSDSPRMQLLLQYERASHSLLGNPQDAALQERLHHLSEEMDRMDGWSAEAHAKSILTRLGFQPLSRQDAVPLVPAPVSFDQTVGALSGGERKRLALARLLLDLNTDSRSQTASQVPGSGTDLLILDEPTNHIDVEAITWLENTLLGTSAAILMVTHDRYFLERVVNRIVELDRRKLVGYPGNYSKYLRLRQERKERLSAAEARRGAQLRRELDWLRRAPKARGTKAKARKARVAELQQIDRDLGESRLVITLATRRLGKKVLSARGLQHAYDRRTVLAVPEFALQRGQRIGILGPNGSGKTTFLEALVGHLEPDQGQVDWGPTVHLGYFDQQGSDLHEAVAAGGRVIQYIEDSAAVWTTGSGERIDAAQMLEWFQFPRAQHRARLSTLSGGERRRLHLLRSLARRPNVLLLDEPTNDLDLHTLQVLEEFLDRFAGCLIVVSHDRFLLDRNVDFLFQMESGTLRGPYPTPYETFRNLLRQELAEPMIPEKPAGGKRSQARSDRRTGLTYQEKREFQELQARIAEMEAQKSDLEGQMIASGRDYERLQELVRQLAALDGELDAALQRWLELADSLE